MKRYIFFIFPVLVIFIATAGYTYTTKNKRANLDKPDAEKKSEKYENPGYDLYPRSSSKALSNSSDDSCKACDVCPASDCQADCEPCQELPMTGEPCNCAYNAPARIDPACGWNTWISGSFIYWKAQEKGLDLGYHREINTTTTPHEVYTTVLNFGGKYLPGFKVEAGISTKRDDWAIYLEYTRLKGNNSTSYTTAETTLNDLVFSNWGIRDYYFGKHVTKSKWNLDYNMFNCQLGRPYYVGKKVIFKPNFGLQGGWITQKLNMTTSGVNSVAITQTAAGQLSGVSTNSYKLSSWCIGPRVELNTDWLLCRNFRIVANTAGSLVYQNFKNRGHESAVFSDATKDNITYLYNKTSRLNPNVECELGLGYGSYFSNNEWHFDLAVSYDFHYFWGQNLMGYTVDYITHTDSSDIGELRMHGLTIAVKLDF